MTKHKNTIKIDVEKIQKLRAMDSFSLMSTIGRTAITAIWMRCEDEQKIAMQFDYAKEWNILGKESNNVFNFIL